MQCMQWIQKQKWFTYNKKYWAHNLYFMCANHYWKWIDWRNNQMQLMPSNLRHENRRNIEINGKKELI